jgi:hypothetical protein
VKVQLSLVERTINRLANRAGRSRLDREIKEAVVIADAFEQVRHAERRACAKVVESFWTPPHEGSGTAIEAGNGIVARISAAIRARDT